MSREWFDRLIIYFERDEAHNHVHAIVTICTRNTRDFIRSRLLKKIKTFSNIIIFILLKIIYNLAFKVIYYKIIKLLINKITNNYNIN